MITRKVITRKKSKRGHQTRAWCGPRCGGGNVPTAIGEKQVAQAGYLAEMFFVFVCVCVLSGRWVLER